MVAACGRATSHTYVSSLPVDLEVVKLKPSVAKGKLVLSKIEDMEGDGFFVMFEVHGESYRVSDISDLVEGLVSVIDGYGFFKKCSKKRKVIYNLLMNEVSGSTTINQSRKSVLVLVTYEIDINVNFEFVFWFNSV